MVVGLEISRMIEEFEQSADRSGTSDSSNRHHHEDTTIFQSRYIRHVSDVVKLFRDDGNPFLEQELLTVDNGKIVMSASAES